MWYSGLAPMSTEWTGLVEGQGPLGAVGPEDPDALQRVGPLVQHEVVGERLDLRDAAAGLVGDEVDPGSAAGASQGALTTLKSGASRLVRMTKRSPQWSRRYSTSGWRSATSEAWPGDRPAGSTSTSVEVLASLVMTMYALARVSSRSTL